MHVLLLLLLVGCGRVGFDVARSNLDDAAGDADGDAAVVACLDGDDQCPSACVGLDSDCVTTCGDGRCVGNAGELCTNCAECKTQSVVCGNGICDASESSASCFADCGPDPWPWIAEEDQFFVLINEARAAGVDCPGPGGPMSVPALVREEALDRGARERSWELAHQLSNGNCVNRTISELLGAAGGTGNGGVWLSQGTGVTPRIALDNLLLDSMACPSILDPALTRVGVGASQDQTNAYAIYLD